MIVITTGLVPRLEYWYCFASFEFGREYSCCDTKGKEVAKGFRDLVFDVF